MDIKGAIAIIDGAPCFPGSAQQREAWQTLKSAVLSQPDAQQLKAEIAALVNNHSFTSRTSGNGNYIALVAILRQLSAV